MIDEKKLIEALTDVEVAWYLDGNYTTYDSTTIMDIIEEQPKVGEWIPCSERLPECENGCETKALMFQIKNSDYIEVGHYGEGGKYRDRYFRTYTDTLEGFDASDVIAWQPLPEPYKGE